MRYYDITITNPKTGEEIKPSSLGGLGITSLLPNGQTNPAALNIELNCPIAFYAQPAGGTFLRIWGLGVRDISSALDLNGMFITVSAGMAQGLPLANPRQRGVIVKGQIQQAFGNWIGTDMTVDLLLTPPTGSPDSPKNYILNWRAGVPLSIALGQTFATALPNLKQNIAISPNLILAHDEVGYYASLEQFADIVNTLSCSIIGGDTYPGVQISVTADTVTAWDGTTKPDPKDIKEIAFQDLFGQPTWGDHQTITFKTAMRGDINLCDTIKLPRNAGPGTRITTEAAQTRYGGQTTFNGNFLVVAMAHFGNYRQPDAFSWNTTFWATPAQP